MGDQINLGEALIITGFSIIVVFLVLILISILISGLKQIGAEKKDESPKAKVEPVKKDEPVESVPAETVNDEELVAVISAAIAASMGLSLPEIRIRKINRMEQSTPAWSIASKQEQTLNRI